MTEEHRDRTNYDVPFGVQRTQTQIGRTIHHQVVTVAVAGTRVRAAKSPELVALTMQAPATNTGNVYVGDVAVTRAGFAKPGLTIPPGVDYGPVEISNAGVLYVDADNAGDELVIFGVG